MVAEVESFCRKTKEKGLYVIVTICKSTLWSLEN